MQHSAQSGMELVQFRLCERVSGASRPYAGTDKRFIGVNIAYTVEQLLVEQRTLDWGLTAMEELGEIRSTDLQRLRSRTTKAGLPHFQAAKAPWINKSQLSA